MGIIFNNGISVTPYSREETEQMREEREARGGVPHVLPRSDFNHRSPEECKELIGSFIELNREECTDEEYAEYMAGANLARRYYSVKWRIWAGGIPTEEQMAAEPWEMDAGPSLKT